MKAREVLAFQLNQSGVYERCDQSCIFVGLPIALITQTIAQLDHKTNTIAAKWFYQQLQMII